MVPLQLLFRPVKHFRGRTKIENLLSNKTIFSLLYSNTSCLASQEFRTSARQPAVEKAPLLQLPLQPRRPGPDLVATKATENRERLSHHPLNGGERLRCDLNP